MGQTRCNTMSWSLQRIIFDICPAFTADGRSIRPRASCRWYIWPCHLYLPILPAIRKIFYANFPTNIGVITSGVNQLRSNARAPSLGQSWGRIRMKPSQRYEKLDLPIVKVESSGISQSAMLHWHFGRLPHTVDPPLPNRHRSARGDVPNPRA